jgi:hypothetical protein
MELLLAEFIDGKRGRFEKKPQKMAYKPGTRTGRRGADR